MSAALLTLLLFTQLGTGEGYLSGTSGAGGGGGLDFAGAVCTADTVLATDGDGLTCTPLSVAGSVVTSTDPLVVSITPPSWGDYYDGLALKNIRPATVTETTQYGPLFTIEGSVWETDAAVSRPSKFMIEMETNDGNDPATQVYFSHTLDGVKRNFLVYGGYGGGETIIADTHFRVNNTSEFAGNVIDDVNIFLETTGTPENGLVVGTSSVATVTEQRKVAPDFVMWSSAWDVDNAVARSRNFRIHHEAVEGNDVVGYVDFMVGPPNSEDVLLILDQPNLRVEIGAGYELHVPDSLIVDDSATLGAQVTDLIGIRGPISNSLAGTPTGCTVAGAVCVADTFETTGAVVVSLATSGLNPIQGLEVRSSTPATAISDDGIAPDLWLTAHGWDVDGLVSAERSLVVRHYTTSGNVPWSMTEFAYETPSGGPVTALMTLSEEPGLERVEIEEDVAFQTNGAVKLGDSTSDPIDIRGPISNSLAGTPTGCSVAGAVCVADTFEATGAATLGAGTTVGGAVVATKAYWNVTGHYPSAAVGDTAVGAGVAPANATAISTTAVVITSGTNGTGSTATFDLTTSAGTSKCAVTVNCTDAAGTVASTTGCSGALTAGTVYQLRRTSAAGVCTVTPEVFLQSTASVP